MKNGVDLTSTPAVLGAWVNLDPAREQFVGDLPTARTRYPGASTAKASPSRRSSR